MAARNFTTGKTLNRGEVRIAGSFAPNGSSAITASTRRGLGWSVAYTSTGLYTVTTTNKFNHLVSATATLQLATVLANYAQIGAVSLSNRTIQIRILDVAASTPFLVDVAANSGNRINFLFIFLNTVELPING